MSFRNSIDRARIPRGRSARWGLVLSVAGLIAGRPRACDGQVAIGLEAWSVSTGRGSADFEFAESPGVRINLRPKFTGGPGALRLTIGGDGVRGSGVFGVAEAELESRGGAFRIVSDVGALSVIMGGAAISIPVAEVGTRAGLRFNLGTFVQRWNDSQAARTRLGFDSGVAVEFRVGRRLRVSIEKALAVSRSPLLLSDVAGTDAVGFAPRALFQNVTRWACSFQL